MESEEYQARLKKKYEEIKIGIIEIKRVKGELFELKKYFYGDFKYNENLKKVPNPNNKINDAIYSLENALREAMEIEINYL